MTVNTHKGFTALNRKFILPELRDAVRTVGAMYLLACIIPSVDRLTIILLP